MSFRIIHDREWSELVDLTKWLVKETKLVNEKLNKIMDQNAAIQAALDRLQGVVTEGVAELQAIAGEVKPGMTDDQANAIVNRINGLADSLGAAEKPAPVVGS